MSNARENYKTVFGVYPNGPSAPLIEPDDPDKPRKLAMSLQSAANELYAHWDRAQFAGVSPQAQELLSQIKAAVAALQQDLDKAG